MSFEKIKNITLTSLKYSIMSHFCVMLAHYLHIKLHIMSYTLQCAMCNRVILNNNTNITSLENWQNLSQMKEI